MKDSHTITFYIITGLIIILSFFLLAPKVSNRLITIRRNKLLNDFITQTATQKKITGQQFWQWREFYCPGSLTFSRQGLQPQLPYIKEKSIVFFSRYSCSNLVSDEALIDSQKNSIGQLVDSNRFLDGEYLINKDNLWLIRTPSEIFLAFILPNTQLKNTIGYFDYNEKDKQLTENKSWFNITVIKL